MSEQASALFGEVRTAFCAGAWIAVIVLVLAVVDAQLRETEASGFEGGTKRLFESLGKDPRFQALRERRNALVHVHPDSAAITVDDMWFKQSEIEQEARHAVTLMFEVFRC